MDVLVINGPNLNRLGLRQPEVYGTGTLTSLEAALRAHADELRVSIDVFQSNHEGDIIDRIHQAQDEGVRFIIINPGGYTHTSVAIRDALAGGEVPFFEVHISNIHAREQFRHHSYLSALAAGVIVGFGPDGYRLALDHIAHRLRMTA